jgi:hypothetical protein
MSNLGFELWWAGVFTLFTAMLAIILHKTIRDTRGLDSEFLQGHEYSNFFFEN